MPQSDRLFAGVLRGQPLLLNILLTDRDGRRERHGLPARVEVEPTVAQPYVQAVVSSGKAIISELTKGACRESRPSCWRIRSDR